MSKRFPITPDLRLIHKSTGMEWVVKEEAGSRFVLEDLAGNQMSATERQIYQHLRPRTQYDVPKEAV